MNDTDLRYRTSPAVVKTIFAFVVAGIAIAAFLFYANQYQHARWDWKLVELQNKQPGNCLMTLETELKYPGVLNSCEVGTVWVTLESGRLVVAESQTIISDDATKARCEIHGDFNKEEISSLYFGTNFQGRGLVLFSFDGNYSSTQSTIIKKEFVAIADSSSHGAMMKNDFVVPQ